LGVPGEDRCTYREGWVAVKTIWHLALTLAEHDALLSGLGQCAP
jgi:hypothetical protein